MLKEKDEVESRLGQHEKLADKIKKQVKELKISVEEMRDSVTLKKRKHSDSTVKLDSDEEQQFDVSKY